MNKEMLDKHDKAASILLEGLMTDGGHHKQYYMEQALRALLGDTFVDRSKARLQWEEGLRS